MHSVEDGFISPVIIQTETAALSIAEIRVVCREGYFGPDCGCSPRDDSTGHFTCAIDGTVVCLHGYQDPETNCVVEAPTSTTVQEATTTGSTHKVVSDTGTLPPFATASIAVGGSIGGFILLLIALVILVVLVSQCTRRRRTRRADSHISEHHCLVTPDSQNNSSCIFRLGFACKTICKPCMVSLYVQS